MAVIKIYKKHTPLAHKKIFREKYHAFLLSSITFSLILISLSVHSILAAEKVHKRKVLGINISNSAYTNSSEKYPAVTISIPTETPTPFPPTPIESGQAATPTPTVTPTPKPKPTPTPTIAFKTTTNNSQYTAEKIGDSTWRVTNVQNDSQMASPQDIFNALNSYRGSRGVSILLWDDALTNFAQSRANTFAAQGSLDGHAGFRDFMNNDGFSKIGLNSLGENSAFLAGPMNGERIIKEIYGADSAHDGNQLDSSWQYIGVGINGNAVNINFGKNKR